MRRFVAAPMAVQALAPRRWARRRRAPGADSESTPAAAEAVADPRPARVASMPNLGLRGAALPDPAAAPEDSDPAPQSAVGQGRAGAVDRSTLGRIRDEVRALRAETAAAAAPPRPPRAETAVPEVTPEMARLATLREAELLRQASADATEVLRGRAAEYMKRVPELNPALQQERLAAVAAFGERWSQCGTEQDRLQLVEGLSDEEALAAMRAGGLDPLLLAEGSQEVSLLPSECLRPSRHHATRLLGELAARRAQPGLPTDDESAVLAAYRRGDMGSLTSDDIATLERYERRAKSSYTTQPNRVLHYAAEHDTGIRHALAVLDATRRMADRDHEFQAAMQAVHGAQREDDEAVVQKQEAQRRRPAADQALFFDKRFSRPPKRALPPGAPKASVNEQRQARRRRNHGLKAFRPPTAE